MPATLDRKIAAILECCLYADDLDAAEAFYGGLLGLERVTRHGNRHVFFRCGAQMLLVFNPAETEIPASAGAPPIPAHGARGTHGLGHLCFQATRAELADWQRHLAAAGVETEVSVDWPNGARSIYVRDPAGNSIEFAERALWFQPD